MNHMFYCCLFRLLFTLIPIFQLTILSTYAQDSIQARSWFDKAQSLRENKEYDDAIFYYKKAANAYQTIFSRQPKQHVDTTIVKKYLNSIYRSGACYLNQAKFTLGKVDLANALASGKAIIGMNHIEIAKLHNFLGIINSILGDYDTSVQYFRTSIQVWRALGKEEETNISNVYSNLGLTLREQGKFNESIENMERALAIEKKVFGENHEKVLGSYLNIGSVHSVLGRDQEALKYYEMGLQIAGHLTTTSYNYIGTLHQNIGLIYSNQGKHEAGLDQFNKALDYRKRFYGNIHPEIGETYKAMGMAYLGLASYAKAEKYLQEGLSINIQTLGPDHPNIANMYIYLAKLNEDQKKYNVALDYHLKALHITQEKLGENHLYTAESNLYVGKMYRLLGDFKAAMDYFEQAMDIAHSVFTKGIPLIPTILNQMGEILAEKRSYQPALNCFQRALMANLEQFSDSNIHTNPHNFQHYISGEDLIQSLHSKGSALKEKYLNQTRDVKDLQLAAETFGIATDLLEQFLPQYTRDKDKFIFLEKSFKLFEESIGTLTMLSSLIPSDSLVHASFALAEKSKTIMMREAINQQEAEKYAGIPDTLIERSRALNRDLSNTKKVLFEEKSKGLQADSLLIRQIQYDIMDLHAEQDSLIYLFKNSYPTYHRLKYNNKVVSAEELQHRLEDNQTLLEFFWGDKHLYGFLIHPDTILVKKLTDTNTLHLNIQQHLEALLAYYLSDNKNPDELDIQFKQTAFQLYHILLDPFKDYLNHQLIIIPDGELGYISFAALLTEPATTDSFADFSYLLKKHTISYAFSSTLLYQMEMKEISPSKEILAVAPSFQDSDQHLETISLADIPTTRRDYLGPLTFNQSEANAVSECFRGRILLDTSATLERFLKLAPQYRILHLSTHGKLNDQNSNYSFLAFYSKNDSISLGSRIQKGVSGLYLADLYNLQLNAEMVVLSACESGVGQIYRGEGMASLASGFSYAGAKSIVTTLWSVNDKASADLMTDFYQYLSEGKTKDEALRQSQLGAIEAGTSPYFWAGFIPIGSMKPIRNQSYTMKIGLVLLISLLTIGLGGLIKRYV